MYERSGRVEYPHSQRLKFVAFSELGRRVLMPNNVVIGKLLRNPFVEDGKTLVSKIEAELGCAAEPHNHGRANVLHIWWTLQRGDSKTESCHGFGGPHCHGRRGNQSHIRF